MTGPRTTPTGSLFASVQDRPPNFRNDAGKLYLVRCFVCSPDHGRENWALAVADGQCCWCGWKEEETG